MIAAIRDVEELVGRVREFECGRLQAWGESNTKIGLVVTLLTSSTRLEENKRSDVGRNNGQMLQLLTIRIS